MGIDNLSESRKLATVIAVLALLVMDAFGWKGVAFVLTACLVVVLTLWAIVAPDDEKGPTPDLSDPDAVRYCPVCGAGYGTSISRCADCDVDLLTRSELEMQKPSDEPRKDIGAVVPLCNVSHAEAWLLAAELEQAEIPFYTKEHGIQGIHFGGVKLPAVDFFIPEAKFEEAERLLSKIEESEEHHLLDEWTEHD